MKPRRSLVLPFLCLVLAFASLTCNATRYGIRVRRSGSVTSLSSWVGSGPQDSPALTEIALNQTAEIFAGYLVAADELGEAAVAFSGCPTIYLFNTSQLQVSACRKGDAASGNALCAQSGAAAFRNCASDMVVQTLSANVLPQGTWFEVIFLPGEQITLVTVMDASVLVEPVLEGGGNRVGAGTQVNGGEFYYTMPDPQREIGGVPAREARPLEELPPLVAELGPQVEEWLRRAGQIAEQDGALPPNWPFSDIQITVTPTVITEVPPVVTETTAVPTEETPIVVETEPPQEVIPLEWFMGGGPMESPILQVGILHGVSWLELLDRIAPNQDVPIFTVLREQEIDVRTVEFNPEASRSFLAEAGYPGGEFGELQVFLVFNPQDELVARLVEGIAAQLNELGALNVELVTPLPEEVDGFVKELLATEHPVLWLKRR
jgi:hypothetical protein